MKSGIALSPVEQKVTPHEGDFRRRKGLCALAAGRRGLQAGRTSHTHKGALKATHMSVY